MVLQFKGEKLPNSNNIYKRTYIILLLLYSSQSITRLSLNISVNKLKGNFYYLTFFNRSRELSEEANLIRAEYKSMRNFEINLRVTCKLKSRNSEFS